MPQELAKIRPTRLRLLAVAGLFATLIPSSAAPAPRTSVPILAPQQQVFGYSAKGQPLVAHIFGNGPDVTMIFGAFHDDEPASPQVVEALRGYLAENPGEWTGKTVVLVPVTNPDGQPSGKRVNAHGVDLNRNFPGTWEKAGRAARYNPGPAPASEPETRAVMELVDRYATAKIVSIHQPFHCLNWNGEKGHKLAEIMKSHNGYATTGDIGYPTPGSFGSYCARKGIAIVTLEMPSTDFATCWRQNRNALLAAIRADVSE